MGGNIGLDLDRYSRPQAADDALREFIEYEGGLWTNEQVDAMGADLLDALDMADDADRTLPPLDSTDGVLFGEG